VAEAKDRRKKQKTKITRRKSLLVTPECFYQGSIVFKKTSGFPIKNFGNDGGGWMPDKRFQA